MRPHVSEIVAFSKVSTLETKKFAFSVGVFATYVWTKGVSATKMFVVDREHVDRVDRVDREHISQFFQITHVKVNLFLFAIP
jgi:hypothetical protein